MSLDQGSWRTEVFEDKTAFSTRFTKKLYDGVSDFQSVEVYSTVSMGNALLLGGCFMITEKDCFAYHEMLVHPAANTVQNKESALVIGGGDGGAITELVKHKDFKSLTLCEIDPEVTRVCRKYFPEVSSGLEDPRVTIRNQDAAVFMDGNPDKYDIILVDSTDPVGPGKVLFEKPFFENVRDCLKPGGVAVFQTESPFFMEDVFIQAVADLSSLFGAGKARPYLATIPSYPGGLWSFTFCSMDRAPLGDHLRPGPGEMIPGLGYYDEDVHRAAFVLPPFVKRMVRAAGKREK
jgi:spermidine synthase